jgi:hypothetical protein
MTAEKRIIVKIFKPKLNLKTMNEDQADRIIDLLSEISEKLSNIDNKTSELKDLDDVWHKLDDINDSLVAIENNTSN